MAYRNTEKAKNEAVEWALTHGMAIKQTSDSARHPAFTLTPTAIARPRFEKLKSSVPLLAKLIHAASEDAVFIQEAIAPITSGDIFFKALLQMHSEIHHGSEPARRVPLLIMRSDFMDDETLGPKLVEFNGIAAGMGPFGQRIHELHRYLSVQWPTPYKEWAGFDADDFVENLALGRLAEGIEQAARQIKNQFGDEGARRF